MALIDPNHQSTTFESDQNGRLIEEKVATKAGVKYSYNARDLLTQVINARGQKRHLVYDAVGRLHRLTDPEGTVTYTYDDNGNVLTVTNTQGTISRQYDALNRMTQYTNAQGQTLSYEYDEVGNLVVLTYPDGKKVHYEYDAADQLIQVTDWVGRSTRYEYDANGQLIKTLRPNETQMSHHYDAVGQLVQQVDQNQQGHLIAQFDFDYDAAGHMVQEQMIPRMPFSPPSQAKMTYTAANRLATYNEQTVEFDPDGNMIFGPVSGKMAELQFDSRNRLVHVGDTSYLYDAENQRIGVNQTRYVVNSQPPLSQVLVRIQADGTQTYYIYGLGLIGQETNGVYHTYHFDYRGSTVALTDEKAQVVEWFQYSPYGQWLSGDLNMTPFLFNGRYGVMTDGNGLSYMRARYYSPQVRRFLNPDVLLGDVISGQTLNRFSYVKGQVISYIDPLGLINFGIFGGRITNQSSKSVLAIKWESPVKVWVVKPGEATDFYTDVDFVIDLRQNGYNGYIDMIKIKGMSHTIIYDHPYFGYPYLWTTEGSIFSIPPVKVSHEAPTKVINQWYYILSFIIKYYPTILEELYALNYNQCRPIPIIRQKFRDRLTSLPKRVPLSWIVPLSLPEAQLHAYPSK